MTTPETPQTQNVLVIPDDKKGLALGISRMGPQIRETLPPGVDADRFTRVAMNAVQNMPELMKPDVDRQTVFNACLRAAQLGLMPDKREGAIVIVNEKRKDPATGRDVWVKTAQFRDMIGGLRKLAAEFGFDLIARSVYTNDAFEYEYGDEERLTHKPPALGQARGELRGAYAIATRFSDGRKYRLVMDMEQIGKRRAVAQTDSVWAKWPAEQGEKTVARALFKSLPLAGDEDVTERLNRLVEQEDEVNQTAAEAEKAAQTAPAATGGPRTRPRALDAVQAAAAAQGGTESDAGHIDGEYQDVTADTSTQGNNPNPPTDAETHF